MADNKIIILKRFFPEPEDPESTATVLPSFLIRRELARSSTLDMEFYALNKTEEDRTLIMPQTIILR